MVQAQRVDPQYLRFLEDKQQHGDFYSETYKEIDWFIKRSHSGNWGGYLKLINKQANAIRNQVHGDFTYGRINSGNENLDESDPTITTFGFDTCHMGDYLVIDQSILNLDQSLPFSPGIYKDYHWMINHIKTLVDRL